jgi:hypothetical protein
MTKQKTAITLVLCFLLASFLIQVLIEVHNTGQGGGAYAAGRRRSVTNAQKRREAARRSRLQQLEYERKRREDAKKRPQSNSQLKKEREQRHKEFQERIAENRKEFLSERHALAVTDEQWKLIKAKLEKVRDLRNQPKSAAGLFLTSSSAGKGGTVNDSRNGPAWQWEVSWKDKPPTERTEGQKIADELMDLVDNENTTAEAFMRKMAALRKCRSEEDAEKKKRKKELSEAQQELRDVLTARQEAALVLMHWL